MNPKKALKVSLAVITLASVQGLGAIENDFAAPSALAANSSQQVVMYATSWCGYCRKAREYLKRNRIPYVEYDIEKSSEGKRRFAELGGRGVPLILVGTQQIRGWDPGALEAALARARIKPSAPTPPAPRRERDSVSTTPYDHADQGMSMVTIITPSSDSDHRYTIHLRDRRTLHVDEYWMDGDQIKYEKFGGFIGVERKDVVRIEDKVTGTSKRYK